MRLIGKRFDCWKEQGHGKLNFYRGFYKSCNVVFYNTGIKVGPGKIAKTAANFGLGLPTNIDLPYEDQGFIPTEKWKKRQYKISWYPGDTLNMAIGQGYILTTPMQQAVLVSGLTNSDGLLLKPYLVKRIVSVENKNLINRKREIVGKLNFKSENIEKIKQLMRDVVKRGTGRRSFIEGYEICGKTGTAEIGKKKKTHAWFISFAPYEEPELVMVVFVEEGGYGGDVAAGLARQIYDWWQKNRSVHGKQTEQI